MIFMRLFRTIGVAWRVLQITITEAGGSAQRGGRLAVYLLFITCNGSDECLTCRLPLLMSVWQILKVPRASIRERCEVRGVFDVDMDVWESLHGWIVCMHFPDPPVTFVPHVPPRCVAVAAGRDVTGSARCRLV